MNRNKNGEHSNFAFRIWFAGKNWWQRRNTFTKHSLWRSKTRIYLWWHWAKCGICIRSIYAKVHILPACSVDRGVSENRISLPLKLLIRKFRSIVSVGPLACSAVSFSAWNTKTLNLFSSFVDSIEYCIWLAVPWWSNTWSKHSGLCAGCSRLATTGWAHWKMLWSHEFDN